MSLTIKSVFQSVGGGLSLCIIVIALSASPRSLASEQRTHLPTWLQEHIGDGEGQITSLVLRRARALYRQKVSEGKINNLCYFAMDATRPHDLGDNKLGRRFYIICESERSFRAISAGHGVGRDLKGIADFSNSRRCEKNFSNAMDSRLTTGGSYVTSEIRTSFKGYYRTPSGDIAALNRPFILFDGEGETANAREREIGGHAAVALKNVCLRRDPQSPWADSNFNVPFGNLVNYAGGRSDGCTSWSPSDADQIIALVKDNPTTLYVYPAAADIAAVAQATAQGRLLSGKAPYWNASCLNEIRSPRFWPKETLEPILAQYEKDHPPAPPQPTPICKAQ